MKILMASNAPWIPSGYGQQAKFLIESFQKNNHEIIFASNFGVRSGSFVKDGVTFLPDDNDYGNKTIGLYTYLFKPDIIVSLIDWFILDKKVWGNLPVPWLNWTPIDSQITLKPNDVYYQIFNKYVQNCNIVTMSEFGTKQVNQFGQQPVAQIAHSVDPNIFTIMDKKECRDVLIPNHEKYDLIIGMVMGNYDPMGNRKAFNLQFEAVKIFAQNNSDLKILLYIHTEKSPSLGGLDLQLILNQVDLPSFVDIMFTPSLRIITLPFNTKEMAQLYNCFDVLMNASTAEGFGIPIIEAQACGVPVITHNFSSMPEITHYGYSARSDDKILSVSRNILFECDDCDFVERNDYFIGTRRQPDVEDMVIGLEEVTSMMNIESSQEAHDWVAKMFNPATIGNYWEKTITSPKL